MEFNDKQLQILAVAEKLFAELGFAGTSVRQIAKEAEINIAMISYYFGSKEKLLEQLLVYRMSNFKFDLLDIIKHDDRSYSMRLEQLVSLYIQRIHKNNRIYRIIHSELQSPTRNQSFEIYQNQKDENFKTLEAFIKQGQQAGAFKTDVEIMLLIPTLIGTYFHFKYNQDFFIKNYKLNSKKDIDQFVETTLTKHLQSTFKALLTYEN